MFAVGGMKPDNLDAVLGGGRVGLRHRLEPVQAGARRRASCAKSRRRMRPRCARCRRAEPTSLQGKLVGMWRIPGVAARRRGLCCAPAGAGGDRASSTAPATAIVTSTARSNTQGRVNMIRENVDRQPLPAGPRLGLRQQRHLGRQGCRAQFSYGRDDGGGGNWGRPGELTCDSNGYRYRYCNADTAGPRQPRARVLHRQPVPAGARLGLRQRRHLGRPRLPRRISLRPRQRRAQRRRRDRGRHPRCVRDRRRDRLVAEQQPAAATTAASAAPRDRRPLPPSWAIGSYQAYDPDSGDIVQLVVDGGGRVYLRNEIGDS